MTELNDATLCGSCSRALFLFAMIRSLTPTIVELPPKSFVNRDEQICPAGWCCVI